MIKNRLIIISSLIMLFISSIAFANEWSWDTTPVSYAPYTAKILATSSQNIYIVYTDTANSSKVTMTSSGDSGVSWSNGILVPYLATGGTGLYDTCSDSSGNMYIIGTDGSNGISIVKTTDGKNFTGSAIDESGAAYGGAITSDPAHPGYLYVVYRMVVSGTDYIRIAYSTDYGITWNHSDVESTLGTSIYSNDFSIDAIETNIVSPTSVVSFVYYNSNTKKYYYRSFTGSSSPSPGAAVLLATTSVVSGYSSIKWSQINNTSNYVANIIFNDNTTSIPDILHFDQINTSDSIINSKVLYQSSSLYSSINNPHSMVITNNSIDIQYIDSATNNIVEYNSVDNGNTFQQNIINSISKYGGNLVYYSLNSCVVKSQIYTVFTYTNSYPIEYEGLFINNVLFSNSSPSVQSTVGISTLKAPYTWENLKDASAGNNLLTGLLPIVNYEWNGQTYNQVHTDAGNQYYSIKYTSLSNSSVQFLFGFKSSKVEISTPSTNTYDVCIDWLGNTAVCPATDTSGDDRLPPGTDVLLEPYEAYSISAISASGTQVIYVRAWR